MRRMRVSGVNYSMVMRVELRGEEYLIAVPREAVEELHLTDGAEGAGSAY